jgi:hypothetical protein
VGKRVDHVVGAQLVRAVGDVDGKPSDVRPLPLFGNDQLEAIAAPQYWSKSSDGGPRKVIREGQRIAETPDE